MVFLKVFPLKLGRQFLSVTSFDGGCCVEAHVPYKTAVSSLEPAGVDLPLARPVKASWRIYYYLWSGCTPLNSDSVVFFMPILTFFLESLPLGMGFSMR